MHVCMEEAVRDRLAQEGADYRLGELVHVMAGGDQRGAVRQFDAIEPFERHHLTGGPLPIDRGDEIMRLGGHVLRQLGGRGGFAAQVELARGPALEGLDDEAGAQARGLGPHCLDLGGGPFIGVDRLGEFGLDARAQDLDRDLAAIGGDRDMDLRDRRGADRVRIDRGEQRVDRAAEARLDPLADDGEGDGGQRVLEAQQIVRGFLADQIGARRQRLAELDRRGADILERVGIGRHQRHARAEAGNAGEAAHGLWRVRIALDPAQRAVTREDAAPFEQAEEMDGGGGHLIPLPLAGGARGGECHGR